MSRANSFKVCVIVGCFAFGIFILVNRKELHTIDFYNGIKEVTSFPPVQLEDWQDIEVKRAKEPNHKRGQEN